MISTRENNSFFFSNKWWKTSQTVLSVSLLLLTIFIPLSTSAAINEQINYQGKLTDSAGDAVADASYSIVFRLYTVSSGGTNIWTETQSVTTTNGLFSVMLGSGTSLSNIDFNQTLYLGVNVNADGEMSPRKIIGAVPAAFYANDSDTLDGLNATDFLYATTTNATATISTLNTNTLNVFNSSTTNATTTNLFVSGNTRLGSLTGVLKATAGVVTTGLVNLTTEISGVLGITNGGTGTSTPASSGQVLSWNGTNWQGVATSSLGISGGAGHDPITLAGALDYLTLSTQQITLNAIDLATDITGLLAIANGGTGTSTQVTNGLNYYDGTRITSGTSLVFNGTNFGIGTSTPGSILSVNGVANFTSATSTFYSSGGINLAGGCFSISGTCLSSGGGGTPAGSTGQIQLNNAGAFGVSSSLHFTNNGLYVATTSIRELGGIFTVGINNNRDTIAAATTTYISSGGSNIFSDNDAADVYLSVAGEDNSIGGDFGGNGGDVYMSASGNGDDGYGNDGTVTIGNPTGLLNARLNLYGTQYISTRLGIGSTTPGTALSIGTGTDYVNVLGTATSTFSKGIELKSGCFSVNGTCISGSGGGSHDPITLAGALDYLTLSTQQITLNAIDLATDITGLLSISNGGTGTSTQVTNGLNYYDGTRITSGTSLVFNGTNFGIGTSTPGSLLSLNGVANFTSATSTFYSSGGINLAGGCFSISGTCLSSGGGGTPAGSTGQIQFNNSGSFGASSDLYWDSTALKLSIATTTTGSGIYVNTINSAYTFTQASDTKISTGGQVFGSGQAGADVYISEGGNGSSFGGGDGGDVYISNGGGGGTGSGDIGGDAGNLYLVQGGEPDGDIAGNDGIVYIGRSTNGLLNARLNLYGTQYISTRLGIGTTTPGTALSLGNTGNNTINISTTATSTFGSGINIRTGCFSVNGTCISGSGGGSHDPITLAGALDYLTLSTQQITLNAIDLATDITGLLSISNGGTGTSTQVTNGLNYYDGTRITSGTSLVFNGTNFGIGTSTPGSLLSLNGVANFTSATSTFYSSGGINLAGGCFAIGGTCISAGGGGSGTIGSGTTGQFPYYAGDGTTLTATSTIFLDISGRVGIGSTTPSQLLSVGSGFTVNALGFATSTSGFAVTNGSEYISIKHDGDQGEISTGGEGDLLIFDGNNSGENYAVRIFGYNTADATSTHGAISLDDSNDEFLFDASDGNSGTTLGFGFLLDNSVGTSRFNIRNSSGASLFTYDSLGHASTTGSMVSSYFIASSTTATSTLTKLAVSDFLNVSSSATSTFTNGINVAGGCFSVNGTCIGGGSSVNLSGATGILAIANGGTATSTQVTNGVNYFDGTRITSGTSLVYNGTNFGIGTSTPGSILSIGGVANFKSATSTFYSTGGINLSSGCFAIGGSCLSVGGRHRWLAPMGKFNIIMAVRLVRRLLLHGMTLILF
jgi:fibronectin-binding autotransporter adhesin